MVSFEEIIKTQELRHVILEYLMRAHLAIFEASGNQIDMDAIQKQIFLETPKFD